MSLLSDLTGQVKTPGGLAQPAGQISADVLADVSGFASGSELVFNLFRPWFCYVPQLDALHSFLSVTKATKLHSRLIKCSLLLSPGKNV